MSNTHRHADPVIVSIDPFAASRRQSTPQNRLEHARKAARQLGDEIRSTSKVLYYRSFDMIAAPYPTKYGLRDACTSWTPFVHILNRMFVIQFRSVVGVKTLVAEPLDREGNAETPFFKRIAARFGGADSLLARRLYPANDVADCLTRIGISPDQVDYVTYDHLHTQDIRRWLGTSDRLPFFPNAKLLVTREEWAAVKGPLPPQAEWYPPHGTEGVPEDRVVLLEDDVLLGEGVALVRTPGHTVGNHSIVVHTDHGLLVTSENGICVDAYAPEHSTIPGLRDYARRTGMEVVLNGNTLEGSVDQYISMLIEKELAGPSPHHSDFPNIVCSSELTGHWLSPGISPTWHVGELELGQPQIG